MGEDIPRDVRVTKWGEDGHIEVLLIALKTDFGFGRDPVMVYSVDVTVIYPSRFNDESGSCWERWCRTVDEVETFLDGLQAGISLMKGPSLERPAIDRRIGLPAPLPTV